jgi:hypothetical protein
VFSHKDGDRVVPKRWYLCSSLRGVSAQKNIIRILVVFSGQYARRVNTRLTASSSCERAQVGVRCLTYISHV